MIQIAICDDERTSRVEIRKYCQKYCGERGLEYHCSEYASGEELLRADMAEILLLDVEMEGMDGIEVKDLLQKQRVDTRILFISSHEEVIPEAFGRQVYGFLKKPLDYVQFEKKMSVMMENLAEQSVSVLHEAMGDIKKIPVNKIQYIQANGKYSRIFLEGGEGYIFSDKSISRWKEELTPCDFGMSHRSYLVNYYYVKKVQESVALGGDLYIPLSRRMEKEFRDSYRKYIWRKAK